MADSSDQQQKINTLLEEGNRSLSLNDYETSVEKLGEACQLLDSIHGELAPESGDAYFAYGRALLQHAIQQNTVLGDSKRQDEAAAASTASSEAKPKTTSNSKFHFEDDDQEEEDQEQDEQQQQGDEEDDEDDFQTAWEILDLSRVILEKNDDKETRLKLADVHLCLGDVSVETEKFDQALPDYRKALEIKKELLDQGDRQLAEAHYKLALALEFSTNEGDQAGEEIKNAIQVLKKRIESIQSDTTKDEEDDVKGKGKATSTPAAADDNKEVKEIKQLIVDMEEKAEELTSRQEKQKEAEALLKSFLGAGGQSAVTALNTATVNDLSSMIKRKSTNNPEGNSNKKQKQ
ncbi:hypothetical protein RO3G_01341 [Lichtheimia corymbifera JMRC:FSU:9682]|uniref:Tetratricopeptide SHNi-TPR domain-containing protein n=1 Tax=Lichtheimia corymbifera JMRC:FSU:9682 TaxID=1263082 RepID=A0A068RLA3_9FUNG|nr:hypothetical protein RO3G_01341 [Lichtheimia corymbifera JMRC:FSU:9682]